jgi:glycine cleavage system H protein
MILKKNISNNCFYTKDHEWVLYEKNPNKSCLIGITDYAQDQLGDIVFIDIFENKNSFKKGDIIGEIESVKSVSNILAPVDGTIINVNPLIIKTPELINSHPYNEGWILKFKIKSEEDLELLLNKDKYKLYLKSL